MHWRVHCESNGVDGLLVAFYSTQRNLVVRSDSFSFGRQPCATCLAPLGAAGLSFVFSMFFASPLLGALYWVECFDFDGEERRSVNRFGTCRFFFLLQCDHYVYEQQLGHPAGDADSYGGQQHVYTDDCTHWNVR